MVSSRAMKSRTGAGTFAAVIGAKILRCLAAADCPSLGSSRSDHHLQDGVSDRLVNLGRGGLCVVETWL